MRKTINFIHLLSSCFHPRPSKPNPLLLTKRVSIANLTVTMPIVALTGSVLGWVQVQVGFAQPDPDPNANLNLDDDPDANPGLLRIFGKKFF